jgi:hypothetical protein
VARSRDESRDQRGEETRDEQRIDEREEDEKERIEETEEKSTDGYSRYEGTPHIPHLEPEPGTYDVNDASNASPTSNVRAYDVDDALAGVYLKLT